MSITRLTWQALFVCLLTIGTATVNQAVAQSPFTIYEPSQSQILKLNNATMEALPEKTAVTGFRKDENWPCATLHGKWNFSTPGTSVYITLENLESKPLIVSCRVDDPNSIQTRIWHAANREFKPNEKTVWEVPLPHFVSPKIMEKIFAMRGGPGGFRINDSLGNRIYKDGVDLSNVVTIWLLFTPESQSLRYAIYKVEVKPSQTSGIREGVNEYASGKLWRTMTPDEFFPMIDIFGQFKHEDWLGKVHSEEELKARIAQEDVDLKENPRSASWDKFGGWKSGPKQEAKGYFYTKKVNEKWWLVDPEGNLFWSHGSNCVTTDNSANISDTPITDREFYFENLPDPNDANFKRFYASATWGAHNYYENHTPFTTYNFTASNLYRKYGADWEKQSRERVHQRLESWGMNTIANWSSLDICCKAQRRTPYIATLLAGAKLAVRRCIDGDQGYWYKFPDPFDEDFSKSIQDAIYAQKQTIDDPYCIGYFVFNELSWGDEMSLSISALRSPADQPVKIAFVDWLKNKYTDVSALNAVWRTSYTNWDAVLQSQAVPNIRFAREDLRAFYTIICEKHFQTIHETIKKVAPKKLNFGCRFACLNDSAFRACANHTDVISLNKYTNSIAEFRLPEGIDMPCIVGEFHFGAIDRGMFYAGLVPCKSVQDQANHYKSYVVGALQNPYWVGVHWFQYGSQTTTGRGDGENAQVGLVDIADTPYPELIQAIRHIGKNQYEIRY